MELTRIVLDARSAWVRADLSDPYQMHSTLARSFASGPDQRPAKFLWRLEPPAPGQGAVVLVQSETAGRWGAFLDREAHGVLDLSSKTWRPADMLRGGQAVTFRLRANPCVTRGGKRRALLRQDEQVAWLHRQFERAGLVPISSLVRDSGKLIGRRRKDGGAQVIVHAALFEGEGSVVDPSALAQTIASGVGHGKMMGLGLLSVAPMKP